MGARILSFVLGVMLAGLGWAIYDPHGPAGVRLPPLDLGMFEGHRVFIGLGALALGVVSLLSAVLPKDDKPRRRAPPAVDFNAVIEGTEDAPSLFDTAPHAPPVHTGSSSPRPSALW